MAMKAATWLCLPFAVLCAAGCSRDAESLATLPSTFTGTLKVQPRGRETGQLYQQLLHVGDKYGLRSVGDGASNGVSWQLQVFCSGNYTAGATTTEAGDLVLFDVSVYGFKRREDYEEFKSRMLALMDEFGSVALKPERKPISKAELVRREKYMNLDLTSQCG
jgi:hypothetical protein